MTAFHPPASMELIVLTKLMIISATVALAGLARTVISVSFLPPRI